MGNPGEGKEGRLVFEDDFSNGLHAWVVEKWSEEEAEVGYDEDRGGLHVLTRDGVDGVMVWCREELPADFVFEYDVTPLSESGFFLIFFCARRKDGGDILGADGLADRSAPTLFKKYTKGDVNCYHISYRRNESATCNLRKNAGMELLKQEKLEKVLPAGETFRVRLRKEGGRISLVVGGTVFMDCEDEGGTRPVWEGGRVGFRQVYDSEGVYGNVRLFAL